MPSEMWRNLEQTLEDGMVRLRSRQVRSLALGLVVLPVATFVLGYHLGRGANGGHVVAECPPAEQDGDASSPGRVGDGPPESSPVAAVQADPIEDPAASGEPEAPLPEVPQELESDTETSEGLGASAENPDTADAAAEAEPADGTPAEGEPDAGASPAPEDAPAGTDAAVEPPPESGGADLPPPDPPAEESVAPSAFLPTTLPQPGPEGGFAIQLAAYPDRTEADALLQKLRSAGVSCYLQETTVRGETWYRVRVGRFAERSDTQVWIDALTPLTPFTPMVVEE